jgi:ABC-type uncharacterized transport system ATPase subunit
MLGIRIISQYALDELLNKARIKGGKNSIETIERLNDKVVQLQGEKKTMIIDFQKIKDQYQQNSLMMNQALHGESILRTAFREIIENQKQAVPAISATNEELIKELKAILLENFKIFTKQAQLLVDVAENKNIESITAIEEYLATFNFDSNEE